MPGRTSNRTSTVSRASRKSSAPTLTGRSARSSEAIPRSDEGEHTSLRTEICNIFADAQRSTAGHRKLIVSLRKIQEACAYEDTKPGKKSHEEFAEHDFNHEVVRCLSRVLLVRKSETVGDKIVRFLGVFLRHATERDLAIIPQEELQQTQAFPETPSSRLTNAILSSLLPLLTSKEKTVRFRATQIISHIINSLDSIDDEHYHLVRAGLLKRIRDREAMVRVQAVLGLGRLAGNEGDHEEEDEDSDDDSSGLLAKLLEVLQNDLSADVRRTLLLNLPLTPTTLPFLLERARDQDAATRRALYSRLLPALGDFRHLSLSMREKLLRWGLRDRDEQVRKATARLFRERWIEDCVGRKEAPEDKKPGEPSAPSTDALLELLERIDVVNSGVSDGIALEAMNYFWEGRPDYVAAMNFDHTYWETLTAESVFLARSLNEFSRSDEANRYFSMVEEKMPEVTRLGFYLQNYMNDLVNKIKNINAMQDGSEEDTVELEFIVEQILHIAQTLDYSDEIGRRKMFSLLREVLAVAELPEEITRLVVEVLRIVCGTDSKAEREFCGIILEAIAEVHDIIVTEESTVDPDDSFHSARSEIASDTTPTKPKAQRKLLEEDPDADGEKAVKEIMVNMKCLHVAQCMLQNVGNDLKDNAHLVTMLNNLVVPAVRSREAPIRERGLLCLGLCCLLDKTLAEENLTLFLHCFSKGHASLQTTALQILSDILCTHPSLLQPPPALVANPPLPPSDDSSDPEPSPYLKPLTKAFSRALKSPSDPDVQTAAITALSKLMLTATLRSPDLLQQLILTFFDPATADNPAARQALSYFLPVFCHSKRENMSLMAEVVPGTLHALIGMKEDAAEELEEDESNDWVGLSTIGAMLIEWTDARLLIAKDEEKVTWDEMGKMKERAVDTSIHAALAETMLDRVLGEHGAVSKEEKKVLVGMLGKVHISRDCDVEKLKVVEELVKETVDNKVAADAAGRNALQRLLTAVGKAVGEAAGQKPRASRKSLAVGRSKPRTSDEADETAIREDETIVPTDDGRLDDEKRNLEYSAVEEPIDDQ